MLADDGQFVEDDVSRATRPSAARRSFLKSWPTRLSFTVVGIIAAVFLFRRYQGSDLHDGASGPVVGETSGNQAVDLSQEPPTGKGDSAPINSFVAGEGARAGNPTRESDLEAKFRVSVEVRSVIDQSAEGALVWAIPRIANKPESLATLDPIAWIQGRNRAFGSTDADGRASFEIPRGDYFFMARVGAVSIGFAQTAIPGPMGSVVKIRLAENTGIRGRVEDAVSGRAVEGARVLAIPRFGAFLDLTGEAEDTERLAMSHLARTDGEGRFSFTPTCGATHGLWCFVAEEPAAIVDHADPSSGEYVIRVGGLSSATGVVFDEGGAPVAGAIVDCYAEGEFPLTIYATVTTDVDGRFHMTGLPMGRIYFRVRAEGFAVAVSNAVVPFPEGEMLEVELVPEADFRGRVVDHRGRPIVGAMVTIDDTIFNTQPSRMETEEDGSFWSIQVVPEHPLEVVVNRKDLWPQRFFGLSAPNEEVELVVELPATIHGRVTGESGQPISEYELQIFCDSYTSSEAIVVHQLPWRKVQDADGAFEFKSRPGAIDLGIRASGFVSQSIRIEALVSDSRHGPIEIQLERGTPITGRVIDQDGAPIAGARIAVVDRARTGEPVATEELVQAQSDAGGMFTLSQTGRHAFDLLVQASGYGPVWIRDQWADDYPRDIVVHEAGAIEGLIRSPWRRPETVFGVSAMPLGSRLERFGNVDGLGRFRIDGLGSGSHVVQLVDHWDRGRLESQHVSVAVVDVRPGETSFVELSCGSGILVDGVVTTADAARCAGRFRVLLIDAESDAERIASIGVTNPIGQFSFGRVAPGRYVARLRSLEPGSVVHDEREVTVLAGMEHERIEFTVEADAIAGWVRSADGDALVAQVELLEVGSGEVITSAMTDRSGSYRILLRRDGMARVQVRAPGFAVDRSVEVDLSGATAAPTLEHVLVPESRVVVIVQDDRGAAVPAVDLELRESGGGASVTAENRESDGGGRATFAQLGAGSFELSARRRGYVTPDSRHVVLGESETQTIRVTLVRLGSVEIVVRTDRGAAVAGAEVLLTAADRESDDPGRLATTGVDGVARFHEVAPALYQVRVGSGDAVVIEVVAGERVTREITAVQR